MELITKTTPNEFYGRFKQKIIDQGVNWTKIEADVFNKNKFHEISEETKALDRHIAGILV